MKKFIHWLLLTIVVSVVVSITISRFIVITLCKKSCVNDDKQKKIVHHKNQLIQQYHGKEVQLTTADDFTISAILLEKQRAKRVVVLCHGYQGYKEKMRHFVSLFPDDTLILFDFRGHGSSSGTFITFGYHEKYDIKAVVDFLRSYSSTKHLPIIGLGCSMGGASLLAAAASGVLFDALIIDSSFADLYAQVAHVFACKTGLPCIPFIFFTRYWFEYLGSCSFASIKPSEYVISVACPLFIIHSIHDTFTPIEHAYALYDNARGKKHLWCLKNTRHAYGIKSFADEYKQKVAEFCSVYCV